MAILISFAGGIFNFFSKTGSSKNLIIPIGQVSNPSDFDASSIFWAHIPTSIEAHSLSFGALITMTTGAP